MKGFFNLYQQGFVRVALGVPQVRVADPVFNTNETLKLAAQAEEEGAIMALFPELGLSAYSNEDLFHQDALLAGVSEGIARIREWSVHHAPMLIVGAPLMVDERLFNCGLLIAQGRIWGAAVKSYLPNYREFYEYRQFRPARQALSSVITVAGERDVPFGADLLFRVEGIPTSPVTLSSVKTSGYRYRHQVLLLWRGRR